MAKSRKPGRPRITAEPRVAIRLDLPDDIRDAMRIEAAYRGQSMAQFARDAVANLIETSRRKREG